MKFRLYGLCLLIILIFAACQQNETEESAPNRQNEDQFMQIENSQPNQNPPLENDQIPNLSAHRANTVPRVNNATVIDAGRYAVFASALDRELGRTRVATIKYSPSEVLGNDPYT